jgi:hypothetical protein
VALVSTEAVAAVVTSVEAAFVAAALAELTSVALADFAEAGFAQPRPRSGALILPVEVSADQPVRSDTTTEAAARLPPGHTNSVDGETNR